MSNIFQQKDLIQVVLPRTDISPLQIIQKKDQERGRIIGSIKGLFQRAAVGLPIEQNSLVSDLEWQEEMPLDFEIGATLSRAIVHLLVDAKATYELKTSDTFSVRYKNVVKTEIYEMGLHRFIASALPTFREADDYYSELINKNLYVITEVYRSDDFTVTITHDKNKQLKTTLNIKPLVESWLKRQTSPKSTEKQIHQGVPMVFAIRAQRIVFKPANIFLKSYFGLEDPDITKVLAGHKMHPLENPQNFFAIE